MKRCELLLGTIADILGILSCIFSFFIFIMSRSLFKNIQQQKHEYNNERISLQTDIASIRKNILHDNLDTLSLRSELRQSLYSYQHKYWNILSPICIYHIRASLNMIKSQIPERKKEKLCISLDYLIAYLDKKEVHKK